MSGGEGLGGLFSGMRHDPFTLAQAPQQQTYQPAGMANPPAYRQAGLGRFGAAPTVPRATYQPRMYAAPVLPPYMAGVPSPAFGAGAQSGPLNDSVGSVGAGDSGIGGGSESMGMSGPGGIGEAGASGGISAAGVGAGDVAGYGGSYDSSTSSSGGGDGKVICAELHRQGRLEQHLYDLDEAFGDALALTDPAALDGYQRWARPIVPAMQRCRALSAVVAVIARPWILEMAREMGHGRGSLVGRLMMRIGLPLCRALARQPVEATA